MSIDSQYLNQLEPRSWLVCRHVEHWLDGQVGQKEAYAARVVEIYESRTAPDERKTNFHHTDDAVADRKANAQLVMRIVRKDVQLKAELEEAFVLALPDKQRQELLRRLAGRYKLLAVAIPNTSASGTAADLAMLLKEFSESVGAYSKLMDGDGVIDEFDDLSLLEDGLAETDDAVGALLGFRETITNAINKKKGIGQ